MVELVKLYNSPIHGAKRFTKCLGIWVWCLVFGVCGLGLGYAHLWTQKYTVLGDACVACVSEIEADGTIVSTKGTFPEVSGKEPENSEKSTESISSNSSSSKRKKCSNKSP
jgi:hypothetical protein